MQDPLAVFIVPQCTADVQQSYDQIEKLRKSFACNDFRSLKLFVKLGDNSRLPDYIHPAVYRFCLSKILRLDMWGFDW